ncbi:hypothetical protein AVEN_263751-1 [Araneus ventricosus]|uniref:Uncharacterized protein n=1 Tax=Araneus ventricosus TaxID=182803 RepID=A0A4Y2AU89_ARAVE|nr:hypothetical protein AVEN_263751-1 [Araneus ventricosus]
MPLSDYLLRAISILFELLEIHTISLLKDYHSLVARCRPRSPKVPGSKPGSTEDPSCIGPAAHKIIHRESNVLPLVWCGVSLERGFQLSCCPRHLTAVQKYEVCPKIALVSLQNATLI